MGLYPYSIYVNTNNTVYVVDRENGRIQMWLEGNMTPTTIISSNMSNPYSLFVSVTGDIYIGNDYPNSRVDKWIFNTSSDVPEMIVHQGCYGLFVDINDTLYCSITDLHQVVSQSLNGSFNTSTVVAGTGCPGYTSYTLYYPYGIFVNTNFDLYVADCYNNRIQRFQSGQLNGTTAAGNDVPGTFPLQCPTGVVLDANNYLYIVDSGHDRIIADGPNGFRYLVAGYSSWSSVYYNQLSYPQSMVFDRDGNLFVTDMENNRIQKFMLLNNSLSKWKIDFHQILYNI